MVSLVKAVTKSLAALLALTLALTPAVALGAEAIHFEKESIQVYEGQLRHKQTHAIVFHPGTPTGHIHVSLNNGGHVTIEYASSAQAKLVAQAEAAGARVTVAKAAAKKAAVKHKLRYIAAGVLIVVIIVVLIVLLIGRRRTLAQEGGGAAGEPSAGE